MAFFSLTTQQEHQQRDQVGSDSLFLYRSNNEDNSFYKGFELWHPQQQQQQQQQFQEYNFYSSARDMPVGSGRGTSRKGHDDGYGLEMMMRGVEGGGGGGGGGGVISCQDCGNQAKKDCIHMRCRTCCKSRGLDCQTHVKSTWVPASVRRDKSSHQQHLQVPGENSKRLRDKRPTSSSTGIQVNDFPPELTSTATFRCVRVSSIDDADEEYAYQTAVNIGGHVFKGILYDQGPDKDYNSVSTALETCTIGPAATPATALFESCINYPSPLGTFVSGAPFLYNPRS